MSLDIDTAPPIPDHIRLLDIQTATTFLQKKSWSVYEATLLLSGLDPNNAPFFEADDANEFWLPRTIWQAMRIFYRSDKPILVSECLDWAINGTESNPRKKSLPFAEELYAAREGKLDALKSLLSQQRIEAPRPDNKHDNATANWKKVARQYAIEYGVEQTNRSRLPNTDAIAEHVAKRFLAEKINTPSHRPPSAGYIKRHALGGISSEINREASRPKTT